jgi:sulfatase maturation enzyme AslB (radical SAM superfamily)
MRISLNPTYLCNLRCKFCYLGEQNLSNPSLIDLDRLDSALKEISFYKSISGIDLYGGEIGLLKEDYFYRLIKTIRPYYSGNIDVTTNLTVVPDFFYSNNITLAVSYDGPAREKHQIVLKNMRELRRPFRILVLMSPDVLATDPKYFIKLFNELANLESVELKPYSQNQFNHLEMNWLEQEDWLENWLEQWLKQRREQNKNFNLINAANLKMSLDGINNSFSDDHIYITPNGELSVLDFDQNSREYFKPMSSMQEYFNWCYGEKEQSLNSYFCSKCEFLGHCMTEHIRPVFDNKNSCSGGHRLLKKWQQKKDELCDIVT